MNIPATQYRVVNQDNGNAVLYVDSDFLNNRSGHDLALRHVGFGDFEADTPEGVVLFFRQGTANAWEGMVGRCHLVAGDGAAWLCKQIGGAS